MNSNMGQNRKLIEKDGGKAIWTINVRLFEPANIVSNNLPYKFVSWQLMIFLN